MWGQHVSLQEPRNKCVCRLCKLRLFAHVISLGSNHGMRVCDVSSHEIGLLIWWLHALRWVNNESDECGIMSWPTLMTKTLIIEICKPNRVCMISSGGRWIVASPTPHPCQEKKSQEQATMVQVPHDRSSCGAWAAMVRIVPATPRVPFVCWMNCVHTLNNAHAWDPEHWVNNKSDLNRFHVGHLSEISTSP